MPLKLYLVSVDLLQPGDYGSFKERLRTLDARQPLVRQWALQSIHTAAYLKDLLRQSFDSGDRIVVVEVGQPVGDAELGPGLRTSWPDVVPKSGS